MQRCKGTELGLLRRPDEIGTPGNDVRGQRGFTLVEMLVAVGITIGMILATGVVFRSATEAAGKSMGMNDILHQLRAVTGQLERDFSGLRPDMPVAIVFEEALVLDTFGNPVDLNGDGIDDVERRDRVVFFANGDFQYQPSNGLNTVACNLARIFYGQASDNLGWPEGDDGAPTPPRSVLTRRIKVLTVLFSQVFPPDGFYWAGGGATPEIFDSDYMESATVAFWKNEIFENFVEYYFLQDPTGHSSPTNNTASMIRRPFLNKITFPPYVQQLYLLPDVTDFKVEVWFEGAQEWFPSERLLDDLNIGLQLLTPPSTVITYPLIPFGFYWNVNEAFLGQRMIDGVDWRSDLEVKAAVETDPEISEFNPWPEALRFTFRLYDRGRRFYPEGQTFSYVIKLSPRR